MTDNVIVFPGGSREPTSLEEVEDHVHSIREVYIESSTEAVMEQVMAAMDAAGFDVYGRIELARDGALLHGAIKSLLMRSKGEHHPLQDISDTMYDVREEDGDVFVFVKESAE